MGKVWSPLIPDSSVPRLQYLLLLKEIRDNPKYQVAAFSGEAIMQLVKPNVLNSVQVAKLIRKSVGYVRETASMAGYEFNQWPKSRGHFDPSAIDLMIVVVRQFHDGEKPDRIQMSGLIKMVGGSLLHALTGITKDEFYNARARERHYPELVLNPPGAVPFERGHLTVIQGGRRD